MKPFDIKSRPYIDFIKENKKEDPKFKVCDHVRLSKYKHVFGKSYVPNWSEELCAVLWTYVISNLNGGEIVGMFSEKIAKNKSKKV